jgi:hypothetical protein
VSESERARRQAIRDDYAEGIPIKIICARYKVHKGSIYNFCRDLPRRMDQFADRKHVCAIRLTSAELAEANRLRGKVPLSTFLRKRIFRP